MNRGLELYRCAVLTVIAALLSFLAWQVHARKLEVSIRGGTVDVGEVEGTVDIKGTVEVHKPVEVEGTVYTHRLD